MTADNSGPPIMVEAAADEVVVVAPRSGEYEYRTRNQAVAVTLKAGVPTVVELAGSRQLEAAGVEIVGEGAGELPELVRLWDPEDWRDRYGPFRYDTLRPAD